MKRPLSCFFALVVGAASAHAQTAPDPVTNAARPAAAVAQVVPAAPAMQSKSDEGSAPGVAKPAQPIGLPIAPITPKTSVPNVVAPSPTSTAVAPAPAESMTRFNPESVLLSLSSQGWQLTANGRVLKEFGRNDMEARQALKAIRELHLDQHAVVGGQKPVMEYWLAGGNAPKGQTSGMTTIPFDAASLRVEQQQGQWIMRDSSRVLLNFGDREAEARQGLEAVKRFGFTQVATTGSNMQVFLTQSGDKAPASAVVATAITTSTAKDKTPGGDPSSPALTGLKAVAETNSSMTNHQSPIPVKPLMIGERTPLDWRHLQIQQEGRDWKLMAGSHLLAHFGPDQRKAQQALNAMQYYRFTEERAIGKGEDATTFFLVNGEAAHGPMMGMNCRLFKPDALSLHEEGGRWSVYSESKEVIACASAVDAQKMMEAIKQFKFDHVAHYGHDVKGVTVFVKAYTDPAVDRNGQKASIILNDRFLGRK